jgi:hypothetical protein
MALSFGHKNFHKPDGSTPDSWHPFTCAYCGTQVSGAVIAVTAEGNRRARFLQCTKCHELTVDTGQGAIYPGAAFGPVLSGLPKDVDEAYSEARRCMSVNAFTAAEGLCRKILMHVAVDKGADEGGTFAGYITYLQDQGFITPPMRPWVDLIKKHGNESQHKLAMPEKSRAEGTMTFTAQLLRSVYEMAHLVSQFIPAPAKPDAPAA